jgi:hypothetical protein
MEWHVTVEAHHSGANIYVAGYLTSCASARAEEIISAVRLGTRVIRLDLRAVDIIDPAAFVTIIRALSRWRDGASGQLYIQFPERSTRPHRGPPSLTGAALFGALSLPAPGTIFDRSATENAAW